MNLSIDMVYGEALRRIFAYGKAPVMAAVLTANGESAYEPTGEYETVGLAWDCLTNRVYRVTDWSYQLEVLPPAVNVTHAVDLLLHSEHSVITDLHYISIYATAQFDPYKELD